MIRFNSVGVGADGLTGLGQSGAWAVGVARAAGSVVADNVIGHGESGLAVAGSNNVAIVRNFVGVDRSGGSHPNTLEGVFVQQFGAPVHPTGIVVGGSAVDGNVVRNNPRDGIILQNIDQSTVAGNVVSGNGTTQGPGISVGGDGNTIGPGNVVKGNGGPGVAVLAGVGNTVTRNAIDANTGLGIDLAGDGLTQNDSGGGDGDSGPNNLQNFPEGLAGELSGGLLHVTGTLPSDPSTHYTIEFFASDAADGTGHGEGDRYLGSTSATTDAAGLASIDTTLAPAGAVAAGDLLSATATADDGSTSEFALSEQVTISATTSVAIEPEADTYVALGAPTANFGTLDYADTYGGHSTSCVLANDTSYTLMRFDLAAIPSGAQITHVELDTTTRAGYAQDGDPAHWALPVGNDFWSETGVTWNTRPADGLSTVGDPAWTGGPDIRNSPVPLGAADVWRAGCSSDPDPAGPQAKKFPSTTDGFPRTVAEAEAAFIAFVKSEHGDDGKLSLELWTPNCSSCPAGANTSYWARYYTREAANPNVRPKLVVTYEFAPDVANVQLTGPATTPAGAAKVKLADVPPSLLLQAQLGRQAAPVNETPVNETPVNETPVNELPGQRAARQRDAHQRPGLRRSGHDGAGARQHHAGVDPAPPSGRLVGRAVGRAGHDARGSRVAERHAPRLLRAARRRESGEARGQPDPGDQARRPRPLAQPARQPAGERARARRRPPLGYAAARGLVPALRDDLLPESDRARKPDGARRRAQRRARERDARERDACQRDAGERDPGQRGARERDAVNEVSVEGAAGERDAGERAARQRTPVNETPVNELLLPAPVNETPVNELPVNEIMASNARDELAGERDPGQRARHAEQRHRLRPDAAGSARLGRLRDGDAGAGVRRGRDPSGRHARRPAPRRRRRTERIRRGHARRPPLLRQRHAARAGAELPGRHDHARRLLPARPPLADRAAGPRLGTAEHLRRSAVLRNRRRHASLRADVRRAARHR